MSLSNNATSFFVNPVTVDDEVPLDFTSKIMAKGDFETIRLPYFGKFTVNKNRVKHINKLKNESTRRSNNNKK